MRFQKFHAVASNCPQAKLSVDFVIVGGGIAGLACAVALRRVGHHVSVLEQQETLECPSGPCRIPPNLSKILYHWGLKKEVREIALPSQAISVLVYETNELLGQHNWAHEVLKEARGDFLFTSHLALRKFFYDLAISCGAVVHLGANVVAVDPVQNVVVLDSGEHIEGDVIIGADGPRGVTVEVFRDSGEQLDSTMIMFSGIVSRDSIMDDADLRFLYDQKATMNNWFGDLHSVLGFPIGDGSEFGLIVYGPNQGNHQYWKSNITPQELQAVLSTADPRLQKLGRLAKGLRASTIIKYPDLEDCIHYDGNFALLGEAVHPLPPGSVQSAAMALEDAAVLGRLFSHLYRLDQIPMFLCGYQDLRLERRHSIASKEEHFLGYMTMPPGEEQRERDEMMKDKHRAGLGILESFDDADEPAEWVEVKEIFSYDAEDEADNWWVEWGLLKERADISREYIFEAPAVQILVS